MDRIPRKERVFEKPCRSNYSTFSRAIQRHIILRPFLHSFTPVRENRENRRVQTSCCQCLHISCKPFDWQIDSATQVCSSLAPVRSVVELLTLVCDEESLPEGWRNDSEIDGIEAWHGILWPFGGVKKFCICRPLATEFSLAMESGLIAEILPELLEFHAIVEAQRVKNAFVAFIDARRDVGRPVHLQVTPSPLGPLTSDDCTLIVDDSDEGDFDVIEVDDAIQVDDEDTNASAADIGFKPLFLKDLFRYMRFANRVSVHSYT